MSNDTAPLKTLAVAVLKLSDGRIVLQRRTNDAPVAAGLLGFFGSHIEKDEEPEDCVRRELAEETSLDINFLTLKLVEEMMLPSSTGYGQDRHFYIYEAVVPNNTFDVFEGVGSETYTKEELLKRDDVSEVVRIVLEQDAS